MPRHSPYRIDLTVEERRALDARARAYTSPYCEVIRAKIVLLAVREISRAVWTRAGPWSSTTVRT